MIIPLVSVSGVILAKVLERVYLHKMTGLGKRGSLADLPQGTDNETIRPNWWILGGSLVFVVFSLVMGLSQVPYNQEIVFAGSMTIVVFRNSSPKENQIG